MLRSISNIPKDRVYFSLITLVGLLRFVNLDFLDLQAWDEALYAVRAEGILRFGSWVDQSSFSIDGLYSALHPPLYVWLTTFSFAIFGVTEFAARLFSTVFGGLTLLAIYQIGKRISDAEVGLLAALLYGLNPFVAFFARQGQFDAALVFFLTLSVLAVIAALDGSKIRYTLASGAAVGGALMTKLFVGFGIPLSYGIWMAFQRADQRRSHMKILGVCLTVAALVALPWHVYMTLIHGTGDPLFFLTSSALVERTFWGVEGNIKSLEIFYFINQLIVLFPAGIVWFGFGLFRELRDRGSAWFFLGVWFLVFFIIFSIVRTKLAVYSLPMLVPASLIAAKVLREIVEGHHSARTFALMVSGTAFSVLWASSQLWRNVTKSIAASLLRLQLPLWTDTLIIVPFVIIAAGIALFLVYSLRGTWIERWRKPLPYLLLGPSFAICSYHLFVLDTSQYKDGATELMQFVRQTVPSRIVVAGYERNPQLTYYFEGADIGWNDEISLRRIIPPKERGLFRSWLMDEVAREPDDALVIVEKDKFVRYENVTVEEVIPPDYALVFESRRYAAFRRTKPTQLAHISPGALP